MKWFITTGSGLTAHSAHATLDDALRCVHDSIIHGKPRQPIKYRADTGDDNCVSDGTLTLISWDAPTRQMTPDEATELAKAKGHGAEIAAAWRECPPMTTDTEATARRVTFVNEPVDSVSICCEDRHRQYLDRAGRAGNDVAERRAEFEKMLAQVD